MPKAEQDSRFKFSSQYRLTRKQDFQSVFVKPYKVVSRKLLLLYQRNHLPYARLGIMIGKHHIKLAVHRNRLRRMIRESFRHHKDTLKGFDIIVMVRAKCIPSSRLDVKERKSQEGKNNQAGETLWREDINKLWLQLIDSSKLV